MFSQSNHLQSYFDYSSPSVGADEGNRTPIVSLGSFCSAIELRPLKTHNINVIGYRSSVLNSLPKNTMRTKEVRNAFSFGIPFQMEDQDKITPTAPCIKGLQNKRQEYGVMRIQSVNRMFKVNYWLGLHEQRQASYSLFPPMNLQWNIVFQTHHVVCFCL